MALVTIQRSPSPSNSPESEDDLVDAGSSRQRSFSESYFTVKGAALILPQSECSQRPSLNNGGDIQQHLQQMFYLLRPEDTIKVAVKLESVYEVPTAWRYMAVVCCNGNQDTEESIILGVDMRKEEAHIGLVLPIWANTRITLDGDGGFSVNSEGADYLFKPVSVQAMWSALQSLHKVIQTANKYNYIPKGLTHTWVGFYNARITSDMTCIKEWNLMEDIESFAADSPYSTEKLELDTDGMKIKISTRLREAMMSMDLEETTSKELRNVLEDSFKISLKEYKSYIDTEMMKILGQMDAPTEIFPFLYLGSEWNASNYDELEENGVTSILNVSREIDNFFPEKFIYMNVREFDNELTDLMRHWKRTHEFIKKTKENNGKVLVHCKMGVSRSASTVIAFKMKEEGCSFQDALDFVKAKRNVIQPNKAFLAQLEEYHGILTASKKRYLFSSKSSSEEVDMENGTANNQLGDEAIDKLEEEALAHGFDHQDDYFLPIRLKEDSDSFASDSIDMLSDKDYPLDACDYNDQRARANTYDSSNLQASKFKADNSWINPLAPLAGNSIAQCDDEGQPQGGEESIATTSEMTMMTNITTATTTTNTTTAVTSTSNNTTITTTTMNNNNIHGEGTDSTAPMINLELKNPNSSAPELILCSEATSDISNIMAVATTTITSSTTTTTTDQTVSMEITSMSSNVTEESEDQTMTQQDQEVNNTNNSEEKNAEVPAPYVKEAIPWNPGKVRKQREDLEERIKSITKLPEENEMVGDEEVQVGTNVTNTDVTSTNVTSTDITTFAARISESVKKDDNGTCSESEVTALPSYSMTLSSPLTTLKSSHTISTFPLNDEDKKGYVATGEKADTDGIHPNKIAERPKSVCEGAIAKDLLTVLDAQMDTLATAYDNYFAPCRPPSVYEMEDIDFPFGIVRKTTRELEDKHRSSCHELTSLGMLQDENKIQPVQRSLSLGSERDRPRLERTKLRKTCTPILSPRNMLRHAASVDFRELDLGVEIKGGNVRRKTIDFESLTKESFDKEDKEVKSCDDELLQGIPNPDKTDQTAKPVQTTVSIAANIISSAASRISHSLERVPAIDSETLVGRIPSVDVTSSITETTSIITSASTALSLSSAVKTTAKTEDTKGAREIIVISKPGKDSTKDTKLTPLDTTLGILSKVKKTVGEVSSMDNTVSTTEVSMIIEPSIFSGSVTKITKEIEKQSKEWLPRAIEKDQPVTKLISFPSQPISFPTTSLPSEQNLSHHSLPKIIQKENHKANAEIPKVTEDYPSLRRGVSVGTSDLHSTKPECTADSNELEKIHLLKTKSLDESILESDGNCMRKFVRNMVGKFDLNQLKENDFSFVPMKLSGFTAPLETTESGTNVKLSDSVSSAPTSKVTQTGHLPPTVFSDGSNSISNSNKHVTNDSLSRSTALPLPLGATECVRLSADNSTKNKLFPSSSSLPQVAVMSSHTNTITTAAAPVPTKNSTTTTTIGNIKPHNMHLYSVFREPGSADHSRWLPQNKMLLSAGSSLAPLTSSVPGIAAAATTTTLTSPATTVTGSPSSSSHATSSTVWRTSSMLKSRALQEGRKVRKLQGKTHPLSKLEGRQYSKQRNANPSFYSTM